jgi:integrase
MKISMNLHQKPTGVYYVIFRDSKGKQRWKSLGTKNKGEATRLYNQFKRAYLQGKLRKLEDNLSNITLQKFVDEYLEYTEKTKEANTYSNAKFCLQNFIKFFNSLLNLNAVTQKDIDYYILYCLKNEKNKPITVNKKLKALRAAFNAAIDWSYIKTNPVKSNKFLKIDKQPKRYLEKNEIYTLLSAIDDIDFKNYVIVCLYTGCRRNEVLYLEWKDIDFKNNEILIKKSKSHHSRYIPINMVLREIVLSMKGNSNRIGRLFDRWSPDRVTHKFIYYARKAGVKCRLHDLRHTFATFMINLDVSIKTLQALLGHEDISSTMIYADTMEESKKRAIEMLIYNLYDH